MGQQEHSLSHTSQGFINRVKYLVPSTLTLGSVLCGWYVVLCSLEGVRELSNPERAGVFFNRASQAVGLAIILDNLDGRIARFIGATTPFGVELDSIADALTFGGAAGVLAYTWGAGSLPEMRVLAFGVTFLFVACGALRLARSNLRAHSERADGASAKREDTHFVGLPIPAAAGMLAAIVHFSSSPIGGRLAAGAISAEGARLDAQLVMIVTVLLALLMVSTFPYSKLKIPHRGNKSLGVLNRLVFPLVAVVIAAGVLLNSRWVVLILATLYTTHGPLLKLARLFRRVGPAAP